MSSQAPKASKSSKLSNPPPPPPSSSTTTTSSPISTTTPSRSPSSLSTHFAMIELKQKILTSISKLSDRDTHQIAVEDLEKIIQSLSPDTIPMFLNCLYDASNDPKPAVKKESFRLLSLLCTSHADSTSTHLTRIISNIVRRLKDSDSGVRDSCRDAIGTLSSQYLRGDGENGNFVSVLSLFVKPLFEAMGEQTKTVQSGSAACMAKMVESAVDPPVGAFHKLCPRICKYLNSQNFLAKAALLPVVASLSQVGAIAPQSSPTLLQTIHECLESSDWATRKAAADTLGALASHSSHLIAENTSSTLTVLEACRFDKVKPVRESMTEALLLWKKIGEKGGNEASDGPNADGKSSRRTESMEKTDQKKTFPDDRRSEFVKDAANASSPTSDSLSKAKASSISDKAVGILKKKAPALTEKELNPEFFQKLETRISGDLPVEVVVPRRCLNSSDPQGEEESEPNDADCGGRSSHNGNGKLDDVHSSANTKYYNSERGADDLARDKWTEQRVFREKDSKVKAFDVDDGVGKSNQRDSAVAHTGFSRPDSQIEGSFMDNKGNWLAIQRQLLQLERQQAHLMNMLEDFMGGSHDSMITLENRVRGLERVVEEMARDLSVSSGRRGSNFMAGIEGSSNRSLGKYNNLPDYSKGFLSSDGILSGSRGRDPAWRSDVSETYGTSRNFHTGSRRALGGAPSDGRLPRSEQDSDQVGNRRGWDKGPGPIRLGEGPSARSVWQASKDEATLEAIRVAGEDNGTSRVAPRGAPQVAPRVAIPELDREPMGDDGATQEQNPVWASWSNAMDALHVGDMDTAYAEVLSTGDDELLVKLMDRSGPVLDQLSIEISCDVLHAIAQFLVTPNLFDIGLSWIQQVADLVMESGPDVLGIPTEIKRELLLNLQEASSSIDPPEDWDGAMPDQLISQLASTWEL
ncbi:hypothetical protein BVC80_8987g35 [Macleaya cordata]|uniref:TOG domain-containing protein n=1 Tax=Macleaya cordata TaxID=56857 RepID=A0A200QJ90_MACCD|nr:hypothetical protein BVC80_8987g35 [Macleaya cordata]